MNDAALDAFVALLRAQADAVRIADAAIGMHHGLSAAEVLLLRAIAHAPQGCARPSALADAVRSSASGVTRALLPLEKRGIIVRSPDPSDGRASLVRLSAAGAALLEDASATTDQVAERLFRRLSLGQSRQLVRLLDEVGRP